MQIERVTYQKVFPLGMYINEKIGVDYLLNEGDDPKAALEAAKKLCQEFHEETNKGLYIAPAAEWDNLPEVQRTKPVSKIEAMKADISTCTDQKVLESYKLIVKNNPDLQETYDLTLKKIQNGL
jgi:hypothetical protein